MSPNAARHHGKILRVAFAATSFLFLERMIPRGSLSTFGLLLIVSLQGQIVYASSADTAPSSWNINRATPNMRDKVSSTSTTSTASTTRSRNQVQRQQEDSNNYQTQSDPSTSATRIMLPQSHFQCPETIGLPLGDINILVITDIHGWIAGQHARHEPLLDVDVGDLVSFYQRLQECSSHHDWFLVFNGDFMDGTGLSTVPPHYLAPLLQEIPFDALNVGNHELYENPVVDYMMQPRGFVDFWNGTYLASNVDYVISSDSINPITKKQGHFYKETTTTTATTKTETMPLGSRYTFLHAPKTNATILTFGFLYNFENNCNHTIVRHVETVLQEPWFIKVLTKPEQPYDAIVVLAHMDAVDPLVYTILNGIRRFKPNIPIQFLTGHSHRRYYQVLDPWATSLEAGMFMNTIGVASFSLPTKSAATKTKTTTSATADPSFQYRFQDANRRALATGPLNQPPNVVDFSTQDGRALTRKLKHLQQQLGLNHVVTKCAPQDYELYKPLNDTNSLWWLYMKQVIPTSFFSRLHHRRHHHHHHHGTTIPIFIQGTGALRYTLFSPLVVVDDIIAVSPFDNPMYQVGSLLTARQLNRILEILHVNDVSTIPLLQTIGLEKFAVAGDLPDPNNGDNNNKHYDLYTVGFHVAEIYPLVLNVTGSSSSNMPFVPIPITEKGKPLLTTQLWMDFVRTEWKCPKDNDNKHFRSSVIGETPMLMMVASRPNGTEGSIPSTIALLSVVFLILVVAWEVTKRRRRHKQQQQQQQQQQLLVQQGNEQECALQYHSNNTRHAGEQTPLLFSDDSYIEGSSTTNDSDALELSRLVLSSARLDSP